MFRAKIISVLLSLRALFNPCECERLEVKPLINKAGRLSVELAEASGLCQADSNSFWLIRDSGAPANLYRINQTGELLETVSVKVKNYDWEAITTDPSGRLYIGDFGNNSQQRQNLTIYRYNSELIDTIRFSYPEQTNFPPSKANRNYDCEAMFVTEDSLHLLTKSWGDRLVRHYTLPLAAGTYNAKLSYTFKLNGLVTDATINNEGNRMALLTYGKVYILERNPQGQLFGGKMKCFKIPWAGQAEAITFSNNRELLVSNETGKIWIINIGERTNQPN